MASSSHLGLARVPPAFPGSHGSGWRGLCSCLSVVMQPFLGSVSLKLLVSWPSAPSGFTAWNLTVTHLGVLGTWHDRESMVLTHYRTVREQWG